MSHSITVDVLPLYLKYNFITKKIRFLGLVILTAFSSMHQWFLSIRYLQVTVTFYIFHLGPPQLFGCVFHGSIATLCSSLPCLQQVFHYYTSALDLIQLVNLADLPSFLVSRSECELYPWNGGLDWVWGGPLLFFSLTTDK